MGDGRKPILFTRVGEVVLVDVAEMVGGWLLLRVRKESGYSILTVPVDFVTPDLLSIYFHPDAMAEVMTLLAPVRDKGVPDG